MTRRNRLIDLALAALAVSLWSYPANSQTAIGPPCADRTQVVERLHKAFGERLVGSGLSFAGTVYEIFAAPEGAWTIIVTNSTGVSCLVSTGEAWETVRGPDISANN